MGLLAHGSYHVCLHSIMTKTAICKSRLKNQSLGGALGGGVLPKFSVSTHVSIVKVENEIESSTIGKVDV